MLGRKRSQPIRLRLRDRQPITCRLASISFEPHLVIRYKNTNMENFCSYAVAQNELSRAAIQHQATNPSVWNKSFYMCTCILLSCPI